MESEQKLNRRQLLRNFTSDFRLFSEGSGLIYLSTIREKSNQNPEERAKKPFILRDPVNQILFIIGLLTASWAIARRLPEEAGIRKAN